MSRRTDGDSGSERKRRSKSVASSDAAKRRSSGNRRAQAARSGVASGKGVSSQGEEERLAKYLRERFFDRRGPADLIVVVALRKPLITSQSAGVWQVEKFVADYKQQLVDGQIPEDVYEAVKDSFEGKEKSIFDSTDEVLDKLNRSAPKVKTLVDDFKSLFSGAGIKEPDK